jgi:DNA-binding transcriptional ArsR family regulator
MDRDLIIEIHELHARLCKAIADPKRLLIITELRGGPLTVNELALALDLSQSNTSQHLAVLRERGIVQVERDGLNSYYSLRSKKVLKAIDLLREFMAEELVGSTKLRKAAGKIPAATSRR